MGAIALHGPHHVAHLGAFVEDGCVEDALGLPGAGCPPGPGAVTAVTGELDVDPSRHKAANLALGPPMARPVAPVGSPSSGTTAR